MILSKQKNYSSIARSFTLATAISLLKTAEANAFSITFDYNYDTNKFFDPGTTEGQDRRNTLAQAGQYYTDYISDSLSAITKGTGIDQIGGSNTWTAISFHPSDTGDLIETDLTIDPDEIIIYAGGKDLSSLGLGGTGGSSVGGSQEFKDLIAGRGQAGALTDPITDIGLWGGSISFDTNLPSGFTWHNTIDPEPVEFSTTYDFLSVAIHEIGHILGYGGDSWQNKISGTNFTGSNALAVYQSETDADATSVPLWNASTAHWDNEVTSFTLAGDSQEAALNPSIFNGQRKLLTNLDYAGLEDIGWEVNTVPFEFSPALGILLMCGFFGSLFIKNRLQEKTKKLEISSIFFPLAKDLTLWFKKILFF